MDRSQNVKPTEKANHMPFNGTYAQTGPIHQLPEHNISSNGCRQFTASPPTQVEKQISVPLHNIFPHIVPRGLHRLNHSLRKKFVSLVWGQKNEFFKVHKPIAHPMEGMYCSPEENA